MSITTDLQRWNVQATDILATGTGGSGKVMRQTVTVLSGVIILIATATSFAAVCGDSNGDQTVNIGDAVYMVNYIFKSGPAPEPLEAGDVNSDGARNVGDAVYIINYIFKSGPAPHCPIMIPELTTAAVTAITPTTAECGGNITSDGFATITARGVCWSTNPTPTVTDSKTADGTGIGSFTSSIAGLSAATPYYVRAYATNSAGTGYGSMMTFTTLHETGIVTDIDGNTYQTVKIGDQWWMAENLKVTHYRNGEAIPNVAADGAWSDLTAGAYCDYNNNPNNVAVYGRFYNWFAVNDSRNIAPEGWRVPSDVEWKQLEIYLGMSPAEADSYPAWRGTDQGGKLKETGTTHWINPNAGATNESGLTGLPGGSRGNDGYFGYMRLYAHYWSSTGSDSYNAWGRSLGYDQAGVGRYVYYKQGGFSILCVKD